MTNDKISEIEQKYMNKMQLKVNCIDTNVIIAEIARAGGKTDGVMAPRIVRVADAMPGEMSFLVHKTYVSLMTNIVPNIRAVFSQITASGRPLLEEGVHYVIGAKNCLRIFTNPADPLPIPSIASYSSPGTIKAGQFRHAGIVCRRQCGSRVYRGDEAAEGTAFEVADIPGSTCYVRQQP